MFLFGLDKLGSMFGRLSSLFKYPSAENLAKGICKDGGQVGKVLVGSNKRSISEMAAMPAKHGIPKSPYSIYSPARNAVRNRPSGGIANCPLWLQGR